MGWRAFDDLRLIYGWNVTISWVKSLYPTSGHISTINHRTFKAKAKATFCHRTVLEVEDSPRGPQPGTVSAISELTRPTQPSIPSGSANV